MLHLISFQILLITTVAFGYSHRGDSEPFSYLDWPRHTPHPDQLRYLRPFTNNTLRAEEFTCISAICVPDRFDLALSRRK